MIRRRGSVQINDVTQFDVCCRPNMTHTNCSLYIIILVIIILITIIFINSNLVVTRWQWLFYMYTNLKIKQLGNLSREGYMRGLKYQLGNWGTI